jgi:eukaryotic-like serine/threonine-protein kinase
MPRHAHSKATFVTLVSSLALLFAIAPARAATAAAISLTPSVGPPTSTVVVAGTGFGPSEAVDVTFDGAFEGVGTTDPNGSFSEGIGVPVDAPPGDHTIEAVGEGSGLRASATFLVRTNWSQFQRDAQRLGVNRSENVLSASNVSGLALEWSFDAASEIFAQPTVGDGRVYLASEYPKGSLQALDASSGALLWTFDLGPSYGGIATPAFGSGMVFDTDGNGITYGLDASTGSIVWQTTTGGDIASPAVISTNGGMVYIGGNGRLYALQASTGGVVWKATVQQSVVESSPAVGNGLVYVAGDGGKVHALDALTGTPVWTKHAGTRFIPSPPTIDRGVVFISDGQGTIWALNGSTGTAKWKRSDLVTLNAATLASADGVLYAQVNGPHGVLLDALDERSGLTIWSADLGSTNILGSFNNPGAAVANGVVYTASPNGGVYALDPSTGSVLWTQTPGGEILAPVTVVNGLLYVGALDNHLYTYGL